MIQRLEAVVGVAAGSTLGGVVVLVVLAGLGVFGTTANLGSGEAAGAANLYGADAARDATGGPTDADDSGGTYGYTESDSLEGTNHAVERAWRDGQMVGYIDFGTNTRPDRNGNVIVAPIWAFVSGFDEDGTPRMIEGHRTVLDVVPGDAGYSDLWDVQFVVVPEGYDSESIHSLADLEASGLDVVPSGMLVNCPIVSGDATIESGHSIRATWYREETKYYFDMGTSAVEPGHAYVLTTGLDEAGEPTEVVGTPVLSGDIESDFWRLHYVIVDESYGANAIRSVGEIEASGFAVTSTWLLVNWPVVEMAPAS
jgi:hypothetical protein